MQLMEYLRCMGYKAIPVRFILGLVLGQGLRLWLVLGLRLRLRLLLEIKVCSC